MLGGEHFASLTELSRFVYEVANIHLRNNQPFVGASAFAHKGGMHVHAIARSASSYEHIDPSLVGNERRILVSELSGRSNIMAMTQRHGVQDNKELMERILAEVVRLENQGFQFEAAGTGIVRFACRACAGKFEPHFEKLKYHVEVGSDNSGEVLTEATVKVRVDGEVKHEVAEGDGPVNALTRRCEKRCARSYRRSPRCGWWTTRCAVNWKRVLRLGLA